MPVVEVERMRAGREMDALIAERVFGLVPCQDKCHTMGHPMHIPLPCHANPDAPTKGGETRYSTNISAAMAVLDKVDVWHIVKSDLAQPPYTVFVAIHEGEHSSRMRKAEAEAETVELAICRAALLAIQST